LPPTPRFPLPHVKLLATGADGKPAVASAGVVNTDDARKYRSFPDTIGGEARISVPDGHYGIVSFFPEFDAQGRLTLLRGVTTDFTVPGGDTQTTLDARAAPSPDPP